MSAVFRRPSPPRTRGLRIPLPWWALALPVASFAALLVLMASSSPATAASARDGLAPLLEFLARVVSLGSS
ncbi:hypothetical protein [Streptomyces sp. NPDC017993]|uniref:hypothetical protein n=1 Tax=Streptomyces sp. NPDC017993 TaxID=3365027 RepID=UPI0037ADFEB4